MAANLAELLKTSNLKNTKQRIRVLEEITAENYAVSQPELEKKLGSEIDRVTLYRILSAYEQKGILHKIVGMNGTINYAICSPTCTTQKHHDEHVHFNCTNCLKIYCLKVNVPQIQIPVGFKTQTLNLIACGICEKCSNLS